MMRAGDLDHAAAGLMIDTVRSGQRTDRHAVCTGTRERLDLAKTEVQDRGGAAEGLGAKSGHHGAVSRADHRHQTHRGSRADLPHQPGIRRPSLGSKIAADLQPIRVGTRKLRGRD